MNTPSVRTTVFVALLITILATVASAGPVNCVATPSDPACAPTITMTYARLGSGPVHFSPGGPPVYSDESWMVNFTPQPFPGVLFTGGQALTTPDPFVGFSFGVINESTSNMIFTYDFSTPFSGGPYYLAETIFVGTLIDAQFTGTSTVTPSGDPFVMESYVNGVKIPGFGRGTGCTTPAGVFFCSSGAFGVVGPVGYLSPATGTLEVKGAFVLTPGGQYTLTGRTQIFTPEPGTVMLFGSALLGVAGIIRRKLSV